MDLMLTVITIFKGIVEIFKIKKNHRCKCFITKTHSNPVYDGSQSLTIIVSKILFKSKPNRSYAYSMLNYDFRIKTIPHKSQDSTSRIRIKYVK